MRKCFQIWWRVIYFHFCILKLRWSHKLSKTHIFTHLPYSSPSFSLIPCWSQQMLVFYRVLASSSATSGCTYDRHKVRKPTELLGMGHNSAWTISCTEVELWHEGYSQAHPSLLHVMLNIPFNQHLSFPRTGFCFYQSLRAQKMMLLAIFEGLQS